MHLNMPFLPLFVIVAFSQASTNVPTNFAPLRLPTPAPTASPTNNSTLPQLLPSWQYAISFFVGSVLLFCIFASVIFFGRRGKNRLLPDSASEVSVDVDLPLGRVLNKYVATDPTEISVDMGDVVGIVQTREDGWLFVCVGVSWRKANVFGDGQVGPRCNSELDGDCAQQSLFSVKIQKKVSRRHRK